MTLAPLFTGRRAARALLAGGVLLWQALAAAQPALDGNRLLRAASEPQNWPIVGGTYAEARYSALDQINTGNVGRLKLAWYADFETNRGQQATPLAVDGVLYTSTSWSHVYAYDAATGKQLWHHDPQVPGTKGPHACCDAVNRGLAAYNGKIYVGTLDGRLQALDAKTGKLVWSTATFDPKTTMTITAAPRVVRGKVFIGQAGAEYGGSRGFVGAYDAETGQPLWRFYVTPNPDNKPDGAASDKVLMAKAYATWGPGAWKESGGGGHPWDGIVYDAEYDQVIVGTGSANPWSSKARGEGDNLFVGSLLALDANTGEYRWHYQETPGEDWDYDSTQPVILSELSIDGQKRKVLMHSPKNGFFYVLDRKDGRLISAKNVGTVNWAAGIDLKTGRPIEYPAARYARTGQRFMAMPGPFGSHNWHPMAFSPKTGLVYIPVQDIPLDYIVDAGFKFTPGGWNLAIGSNTLAGPQNEADRKVLAMQTRGYLLAWDPVKQREAWRVQHPNVASAGVLATAGDLVFQGTPDGRFVAYRADSGQPVWSWQGYDGIIAGAMSYAVGGTQYVAVLAGFGGANALHVPYVEKPKVGTQGRLLVFKLDGTATAPNNEKLKQAANVPNESWPAETVGKGAALYGNCAGCHGFGTYAHDAIPDLRRSALLSNRAAWEKVILGGALEAKGMPNWTGTLKPEDTEAIRAYVADRARVLRDDEKVESQARR